MYQSKLFYKTLKNAPKEAEIISHKLLLRGGFISQLASGIYSFLPLGHIVHEKIKNLIKQEMNNIGAQEILLPALQPKELWEKSKRWDHMDPPLFRIKDRHNKEFALGSTHEEVITDLLKSRIQSYKDLPLALFQIQTKFRNEMRFAGGLLRTREFTMKDLYSFHFNEKDLKRFFDKVLKAYDNIFKQCGLDALKTEASGGVFTKEKTYEFQVLSKVGEDRILHCEKCLWAANLEVAKLSKKCPQCQGKLIKDDSIEIAHTFKLGTKYSQSFDLNFIDEKGKKKPVVMGCYGIGIGRLMGTVVEMNNDKKGIIWPEKIAPFKVHLIQIGNNSKIRKSAEKLYKDLQEKEIEVLYDDREDKSSGEKFAEADLIGIPYRIVISERTLEKDSLELKNRNKDKVELVKIKNLKI